METNDPAERALALFDRYAEMPHAALPIALSELQREDADACIELLLMLAADEQTHSFASPLQWFSSHGGAAASDAHSVDRIWPDGTRLGPWCVDGIIGLGGMGVVYAAHRADGLYEREAALKTIRAEIMSPALQQAFAKERSHLAKLDHPSIVALHDAGVADGGQPWLAMQRVHGDAIDRWCDAHSADLRSRVRLLIETCDAIAYAHAHGVLHQDIKPSNVLVTDDGHVKLLDFGLSAIIAPQGDRGFTRIGVSSAYAAPEVFEGAPPSVAIDVYALGVVLYRLLCEGWPRTPRTLTALPDGRDDMTHNPSLLVIKATPAATLARGVRDAQALSSALKGDMDAIALRCVSLDPLERYASVADLREDLQAWLERRPVAASNGGWLYRAIRFVRRNAMASTAAAVLASALIGGGWMAHQQQQRAKLEAENGEILNQLFEKSIGVAALSSFDSTPLSSQALLNDAERQLRAAAGADRSQFLARGLGALARAWLVRADYAKAERLLNESRTLGADNPLQAARTNAVLAQLSNLRTNSVEAERLVREGLEMLPTMDGIDDDLVDLDLRMQRARARWDKGDTKGAIAVLDAAVLDAEALGEAGSTLLAELLSQRGYALTQLFRFEAAEHDLQRSLKVVGTRSPVTANSVRRHLANLLILVNRREEAQLQAEDLLNSNRKLFGDAHPETARAWVVVGKVAFYQDDKRLALSAHDKAERIFKRTLGLPHPDFVDALVTRGAIEYGRGHLDQAVAITREAAKVLERAYGPNHEATLRRKTDLASMLIHHGRFLGGRRQEVMFREAESLLSGILSTGERQRLPVAYVRDEYAEVLFYFHRVDEAGEQAQRGIDEMSDLFGADSNYPFAAWFIMVKVRTAQGRYDEADAIVSRLLPKVQPIETSPYENYLLRVMLLDIELGRGDPEGIRRAYRDAEQVARRYGFMGSLNAKRISGISSPARRG